MCRRPIAVERIDVLAGHGVSREQPQVGFEIPQRTGEVLQVIGEEAAVAEFDDRGRVDREEQARDEPRLRERSHAHVEPLEVDEHADDDLLPRGGLEQRAVEGRRIADMLPQQLAAVDLGEERPFVERDRR